MSLPTAFAALTNATGQMLDDNFNALGVLTVLPGTISGTNALAFALLANTPTISAYSNYLVFSGVAAATNSGPVTLQVGSLPALPVLVDSKAGPVSLIGGEIAVGNSIVVVYDSALNGGGGGFHLINPAFTRYLTGIGSIVTSAVGVTLTANQLTGAGRGIGYITRAGAPGAGFSDTTDTAAAILAPLQGEFSGATFWVRMTNTTGQTQTLLPGAGCTMNGTATTAAGASHLFQCLVSVLSPAEVDFFG